MAKSPFDALVNNSTLSREALAAAGKSAARKGKSVGWTLQHDHGVSADAVGQCLASHYRLDYAPFLETLQPLADLVEKLGLDWCVNHRVAPVGREGGRPVLLLADPVNLPDRDQVEQILRERLVYRVALAETIERILTGSELQSSAGFTLPVAEAEDAVQVESLPAEGDALVSVLNQALLQISGLKDSELRLDSRATPAMAWKSGDRWVEVSFPAQFLQPLVRRLKVMANLDLGNRSKVQSGNFEMAVPRARLRFALAVEPLGDGNEAARVTVVRG